MIFFKIEDINGVSVWFDPRTVCHIEQAHKRSCVISLRNGTIIRAAGKAEGYLDEMANLLYNSGVSE